jgi:hypothetical protein
MAKVGRNEPCPCGSGRKAKRCCGVAPGPSPEELAKARLAEIANTLAPLLKGFTEDQLHNLWDQVLDLPGRHVSLSSLRPDIETPDFDRLCRGLAADDQQAVGAALRSVIQAVDTSLYRAEIATRVLSLFDAGEIDAPVASLAMMDLTSDAGKLAETCILASAAVASGATSTPSGLIVARR